MKYKYSTTFSSTVTASTISEEELKVSKANLDGLQSLIPDGVDLERNIDLIAIAFDAAVANRFNKNDDGIDAPTAIESAKYFIHKPINVEHIKTDVVGHVTSAGFSAFGTSSLIPNDVDMASQLDPFNVALAGVAYKTVNPSFVDFIEMCSDPKSYAFGWVSASWEIGFNDFHIALGGPNLKDAEIITNKSHIKEFEGLLRANDGPGLTDDKVRVYRLITGPVYPVGIGLTTNPAADVKGVYVKKKQEAVASEEDEESSASCVISVDNAKFLSKIEKNISHSDEQTVTFTKETIATMTNEELLAKIEKLLPTDGGQKPDATAELKESVASVSKLVQDALLDRDKSYQEEIKQKEDEKIALVEAQKKQAEDLEQAKKDLEDTKKSLAEIQEAAAKKAATELFNSRLDEINDAYELSDADRKVISTDLISVEASDEAFKSFKEKVEVLFSHKNKKAIAKAKEDKQKELDEAVANKLKELSEKGDIDIDIDKVLASTVEDEREKPNNSDEGQEPSLRERMKDAFSPKNITISQ